MIGRQDLAVGPYLLASDAKKKRQLAHLFSSGKNFYFLNKDNAFLRRKKFHGGNKTIPRGKIQWVGDSVGGGG